MKKLMIAAAVLAALAVAPAFAQTKSAPLDPHTLPSGGDHQMSNDTKPAMGGKNIPLDPHALPSGGDHQMNNDTKPAMGAKNVPVDPHTQIMTGPEHQMPATPPAKK